MAEAAARGLIAISRFQRRDVQSFPARFADATLAHGIKGPEGTSSKWKHSRLLLMQLSLRTPL
jgi:hypothetical protein